jgi:hypothetical protein
MGRRSIKWLLGELPKLEADGVIEDLWVEGLPVRQWLAEGGAERAPSPIATPDS